MCQRIAFSGRQVRGEFRIKLAAGRRAQLVVIPILHLVVHEDGAFAHQHRITSGGALLKGLDSLLRENTSLPINVDEEPLTCVVRGTGRILDDPEKYRGVLTLSRH